MVNYDLPWNPNRLEQRFGRVHRIGQSEVCHLWNLVAGETREGAVFKRLLEKITNEANALNGKVFDVLGELFHQEPLRDLLVNAVRYGDDPARQAQVDRTVDNATEQARVRDLVQDRMLVTENIDMNKLQAVLEESDKGHHLYQDTKDFLLEVFAFLSRDYSRTTSIRQCDDGCFEIVKVPGVIVQAAEDAGIRNLRKEYSRISFAKPPKGLGNKTVNIEYIHPKHPLISASVAWVLQRWQKARPDCGDKIPLLIDENEASGGKAACRVVYCVEWMLRNAHQLSDGKRESLKREAKFVEIDRTGEAKVIGIAPNHNYRPANMEEVAQLHSHLEEDWLATQNLDELIIAYATEELEIPSRNAIEKRENKRIDKERLEVTRNLDSRIRSELRQETHFAKLAQQHPDRRVVYNASRARHEQYRLEFEARKMNRIRRWKLEEQIKSSGTTIRRVAVIAPAGLIRG